MIYNEFIKELKKEAIKSSYLFMGDEEYLMNKELKRIKEKYIDASFEAINFVNLDGKNTTFKDLVNSCETLPFMSSKKMILVKDAFSFIKENEDLDDKFYKYMDDLGDYNILVFLDNTSSIKKNTKFYKYFNKSKRAIEFTKLMDKDLQTLLVEILNRYNKKMSNADMRYFIERTSYRSKNISVSIYDVENELLKLIDFSQGEIISKSDIDKVIIKSIDTNIFELIDAINRFDGESSLRIFNEMYQSNEPVQRIFFMITRLIRLLLSYKLYKNKGYSETSTQEKLGIKDYEFGKIKSQSSNFTVEHLETIMEYLLQMDLKLKTVSNQDKLEMEMLLVKLCKK